MSEREQKQERISVNVLDLMEESFDVEKREMRVYHMHDQLKQVQDEGKVLVWG